MRLILPAAVLASLALAGCTSAPEPASQTSPMPAPSSHPSTTRLPGTISESEFERALDQSIQDYSDQHAGEPLEIDLPGTRILLDGTGAARILMDSGTGQDELRCAGPVNSTVSCVRRQGSKWKPVQPDTRLPAGVSSLLGATLHNTVHDAYRSALATAARRSDVEYLLATDSGVSALSAHAVAPAKEDASPTSIVLSVTAPQESFAALWTTVDEHGQGQTVTILKAFPTPVPLISLPPAS